MIETRLFADDGETPNNPVLPLVLVRGSGVVAEDNPAGFFEERFMAHGWGSTWRWGVYRYPHFHSTNHEVLAVFCGEARLLLGGARGEEYRVRPGDVVILPAGVGHQCLEASEDFQVVGAYPRGDKPDLLRSGQADLAAARARIARVPLPEQDPMLGKDGPLMQLWGI